MKKMTLKIDGKEVSLDEGMTVLQAAKQAGVEIPNMCYDEHVGHFASCMLCVVKDKHSGQVFASCSQKAADGMDLISHDAELTEMRKASLELLLSDHVGDCEAPCTLTCPAFMNIPKMNRLLANEQINEALSIVRENIALPAVLGRICPAPCEKACKRKTIDEPVSICLLKRSAADYGQVLDKPIVQNGKRIALIGAGPAGLSAAYYLQLKGYQCVVYDKNEKPGGNLRYAVPDDKLPKDVLDQDIEWIRKTGVTFHQNQKICKDDFLQLQNDYDALIVAVGDAEPTIADWGMEAKGANIMADKDRFQTCLTGVFAIGNVLRSSQYSIRALGHGRIVAISVDQYLNNEDVTGHQRLFNSRFGFLVEEEFAEYLKESVDAPRNKMEIYGSGGFSREELVEEARRCLHCDCRAVDDCKLRELSHDFGAKQNRFLFGERKKIKKITGHQSIIYEPEKCIRCGICVRITEKKKEPLGLTYIGRGFDVEIGIPFNKELSEAIRRTENELAEACPTGAISKL